MRRALRASAAVVAFLSLGATTRLAHATGVMEFPDNGSEQEGRGGAWVARASDPLATFYNPAGLAGQQTRLTLQANISTQNTCFTRVKAANDTTQDGVNPGSSYPQVCQNGSFFPNPQLAFAYRLTDTIGLGIAILGPSAVGNVTWPDFQGTAASSQRFLLVSSSVLLLTPTIGVGWEPVDNLRVGAAFIAGTAPSIDFVNAAPAVIGTGPTVGNDLRAELKAHDYFIPGFTIGALYSPLPNLDVAAWYKYMSSIDAQGDVTTALGYYTKPGFNVVDYGDTSIPNCNNPALTTNPCGHGNNAKVTVPLPMEAKLGVRFHQPRGASALGSHMRDPIAQDVFDVEADFTWANDSAFDNLQLRFPAGLPANPGITGASLPQNADVRHHFKDVFGVRLGGDYNILPDELAVRAGTFYESAAVDPQYQNIDFDAASRVGIALGGTYRLHVWDGHPIDLMAGYGHVFFASMSNTNPKAAGLQGLTGDATANYRTPWPVNLGTITSSIDVINVGASLGF